MPTGCSACVIFMAVLLIRSWPFLASGKSIAYKLHFTDLPQILQTPARLEEARKDSHGRAPCQTCLFQSCHCCSNSKQHNADQSCAKTVCYARFTYTSCSCFGGNVRKHGSFSCQRYSCFPPSSAAHFGQHCCTATADEYGSCLSAHGYARALLG